MNEKHNERVEFLTDAYRARIQFFSDHANRTWTRFNILLTIETALCGLFINTLLERGASIKGFWLLPFFGILFSLVWYTLGLKIDALILDTESRFIWSKK